MLLNHEAHLGHIGSTPSNSSAQVQPTALVSSQHQPSLTTTQTLNSYYSTQHNQSSIRG